MPLQPLPQVTIPAAPTWTLAWGGDGTNTVQREEDRAIKPITVLARNILCAARVRPWRAAAFIHLNTVEQETVAPGLACSSALSRSSPYCLLQVWPAKRLRLHAGIVLMKH